MTSTVPLIGLYSPIPGSGKSTLAQALRDFDWQPVKFAGPLKDMIRTLLHSAGCPGKEVERYIEGDLKEVPTPFLAGRTPRHSMQTLGSDWARDKMRAYFWVDIFMARTQALLKAGTAVVCDDCRFPNEAEAIRNAGGMLVKIIRPSLGKPQPLVVGHVSEGSLDHLDFDLVVENEADSAEAFGQHWAPLLDVMARGGRP